MIDDCNRMLRMTIVQAAHRLIRTVPRWTQLAGSLTGCSAAQAAKPPENIRVVEGELVLQPIHDYNLSFAGTVTMMNRTSPQLPAKLVFTETEMKLLQHVVSGKDGKTKKTWADS